MQLSRGKTADYEKFRDCQKSLDNGVKVKIETGAESAGKRKESKNGKAKKNKAEIVAELEDCLTVHDLCAHLAHELCEYGCGSGMVAIGLDRLAKSLDEAMQDAIADGLPDEVGEKYHKIANEAFDLTRAVFAEYHSLSVVEHILWDAEFGFNSVAKNLDARRCKNA